MQPDRPAATRRAAPARRQGGRRWWVLGAVCACSALPGAAIAAPTGALTAVDAAAPPTGALRLGLGSTTQLVLQPRDGQQPRPLADPALPPPRASLGLEFKTSGPGDDARNLVRVDLTGSSVLQFRPRGGGLSVSYRAQF